MTEIIPFAVTEEDLEDETDKLPIVIERQISYFANKDGLHEVLHYIRQKSDWVQVFELVTAGFDKDKPREPVRHWRGMELEQKDVFKDLIVGLTNFDPGKRLTAQQALDHKWFRNVTDT